MFKIYNMWNSEIASDWHGSFKNYSIDFYSDNTNTTLICYVLVNCMFSVLVHVFKVFLIKLIIISQQFTEKDVYRKCTKILKYRHRETKYGFQFRCYIPFSGYKWQRTCVISIRCLFNASVILRCLHGIWVAQCFSTSYIILSF